MMAAPLVRGRAPNHALEGARRAAYYTKLSRRCEKGLRRRCQAAEVVGSVGSSVTL